MKIINFKINKIIIIDLFKIIINIIVFIEMINLKKSKAKPLIMIKLVTKDQKNQNLIKLMRLLYQEKKLYLF